MEWINSISKAIDYIEDNLTDDITTEDIAENAMISPFYFQKGFSMLCGYTVGEYIRKRKLTLAGSEFVSTDEKIIDIALKYGYDSPDSFTKAFTRFHGVTPTAVRKEGATIKSFAPLKISFNLKGGNVVDYKIEKKSAFKVMGVETKFSYENAQVEIPKFWTETMQNANENHICGMYGINIDESMGCKEFRYLIADDYNETRIGKDCSVVTVPEFTWAVFPCCGPMPITMNKVSKEIFSEWLPNCKDYEFAAGYCIEMYGDPRNYKNGVQDEKYYSELWIPVKPKN